MSLTIVATPIGNLQDITLRALEILKAADIIIVEEFKESTQVLRAHGISGKIYEQLNEHTTLLQLETLADLCAEKNIALITDCGTPGFCDPGAALVKLCRRKKIPVHTSPGASSLMALLSLSAERLDQFLFRGFLPAETEARNKSWQEMQKEKRAFVILDTPYRLQKTLQELKEFIPQRRVLLALDLTQETEQILDGTADYVGGQVNAKKAEFLVLVYSHGFK